MNHFTIRDIENLCGIRAHTLRVWEMRYGIVQPRRKESKHRVYNTEDLKHILRISHLYHRGYKISRIASMSLDEMRKHTLENHHKNNFESLINQLMEASIDMDENQFRDVLDYSIRNLGAEQCMIHVIYPFLNMVGLLWMTGNVIPAQEHFASNLIRNCICRQLESLPTTSPDRRERTVLFCPPGEYHEIPLLFMQYLLTAQGKRCVNFGCDTNTEVISAYVKRNTVSTILVHHITNFTDQAPGAYLQELLATFPDQRIIASGPVFHEAGITDNRLLYLGGLEEMLHFARQ